MEKFLQCVDRLIVRGKNVFECVSDGDISYSEQTLMTEGLHLTTITFTLSRGDRGYESRRSKSDPR